MAELPLRWSAYARLQEELAGRQSVDDYTWGLEAGLNRLLDESGTPDEVERTIRSEGRKERHRAAQVRVEIWPADQQANADPAPVLDGRDALRRISQSIKPEDWILLRALGHGYNYKQISAVLGVPPGALRARTLRLRRSVRQVAASALAW